MSLLVFLDETGDHSMSKIDSDFPLFALVLLICDHSTYIQKIMPLVFQLKLDFWGHEGIILHSRDIRLARGNFSFLRNPENRESFFTQLNEIMDNDYTIISVIIDKKKHKQKYSNPHNPYDISLTYALERLLKLLEDSDQQNVKLIAEARGKNEDNELRGTFLNIITKGTAYIPPERFSKIKFDLEFLPKSRNIIGTQLADLAAYPIARNAIKPGQSNQAYDIIKRKFLTIEGKVWGRKIFP